MLSHKRTPKFLFSLLAALLLTPLLTLSASAGTKDLKLSLDTENVLISTFYNGTTVTVSGTVASDEDIVIEVSGPREDVHLKEKGKVAGFLWMNKTDVSLGNTPAVYMVYTPAGAVKNYLSTETGIGYQALVEDINITPESEDKAFIFGEYVKLMEESGIYAVNQATVSYGSEQNGRKEFHVTLNIPSKMAAGDYIILASAIKNGRVLNQVERGLNLSLSGFPAFIASLAYDRPLLFGFMAVFIALGAGLLIGVIFRGGGGAH